MTKEELSEVLNNPAIIEMLNEDRLDSSIINYALGDVYNDIIFFIDFIYENIPEMREEIDEFRTPLWHITGLTSGRAHPLKGRATDRYIKPNRSDMYSGKQVRVKVDGLSAGSDVKFKSKEDAENFLSKFENRKDNRQKYDITWKIVPVRKSKTEKYPLYFTDTYQTEYGEIVV